MRIQIITLVSNFCALPMHYGWYMFGWFRASMRGVKLGIGAKVSPRAVFRKTAFVGSAHVASGVVIGEGTYINSGIIASGVIGDWCSIAYNVLIGPIEHRTDYWTMSPFQALAAGVRDRKATERDVPAPVVGNGVWIGANVVVLRGVQIGDGAVIAAGAVVTKDVARNEIWGGVPARKIGCRKEEESAKEC